MLQRLLTLWSNDDGQGIAEYAVMLAVILELVIGAVQLVGGKANHVFSSAASSYSLMVSLTVMEITDLAYPHRSHLRLKLF
jgi:Flp pilus assembly pilin Flp